MGTIPNTAPNPFISDPEDPRYTVLHELGKDWLRRGLISDALTFIPRGYLEHDRNSIRSITSTIVPGDFVALGNRKGVVIRTYTNEDDEVVALTVREELDYVPAEYKEDPESFGYDASGKSRTVIYLLSDKETSLTVDEDDEGLQMISLANAGQYQSALVVLKKATDDPSTWNSIAQSLVKAGFISDPLVVVSVSVIPSTGSIEIPPSGNETLQLSSAVIPGSANQDVTWSVEPTGQGVTVDSSGLVTVASTATAGEYTVTATSDEDNEIVGVSTITVTDPA